MTDASAFRATYSDWKLIRSRKVVQIVLEVPIEAAGQAYDVLGGMPRPDRESWVACARLETGSTANAVQQTAMTQTETSSKSAPVYPEQAPARAPRKWGEIDYPQQAGLLCQDKKFQRFISERLDVDYIGDTAGVAEYVRGFCDVQSRTEIRSGTKAEQRWNLLVSAYRAWETAPSVGAA